MTSNKNKSRGASKSPTQKSAQPDGKAVKVNGGGVKLPVDEKHPNGAINGNFGHTANGGLSKVTTIKAPDWKGPPQQSNVIAANGNAFDVNSADPNNIAKLSGEATTFKPKPAPISFLNVNSTADNADGPVIVTSDVPAAAKHDKGKANTSTQEPIGTRGANYSPSRPRVFFTTDVGPYIAIPGGHYIKIVNVAKNLIEPTLDALYRAYDWNHKIRGTHTSPPDTASNFMTIFLSFDDTRDALAAFDQIDTVNPSLNVSYNSQMEYANAWREARKDSRGTKDTTALYDGQVIFTAEFKGLTSEFKVDGLFDQVQELAKSAGEVLAFAESDGDANNWQFRAEYYSIEAAKAVVKKITKETPEYIGKWRIVTAEMPDYSMTVVPNANVHYLENGVQAFVTPHKGNNGVMGLQGVQYSSPTGRTAWRVDEKGQKVPTPAPKQLPKAQLALIGNMTPQHRHFSEPLPQTPVAYMGGYPRGPRSASWSGSYQAQSATPLPNPPPLEIWAAPTSVDIAKIQNGQDVRTTVMLRNLPNNIGFHELKEILDRTSFGRYDFSYLRVDFANNLNVGYGFVNFTDPMHIVNFVNTYVGRPWVPHLRFNRRRGPRIADVSYATVQGYDCLVEKFRNSSIMDEFADFRPKLWWTHDSAIHVSLVGHEREFPSPNNESKKQRSRDNATQIGLYASGNRRNRNNGRRALQSQYDRGTTAQMQEDAYYNQGFDQMSPIQAGYGYVGPNYIAGASPIPVGPPPPFPQMGYGNMNGFTHYGTPYANGTGVMDPMGYGYVQFTDPFSDHYQNGPQTPTPGRFQNNGRFNGRGNRGPSPNGGYQGRVYHCGIASHQIPKAIKEEHSGASGASNEPTSKPNDQYDGDDGAEGYDNTYPPPY